MLSQDSGCTGYVPVDRLYQTVVSFASDKANFAYASFISDLLNMRSSHNCEFVTNEAGTITHARITQQQNQTQQLAFQQHQHQHHQPQTQSQPQLQAAAGGRSSNVLFNELYRSSNGSSTSTVASTAILPPPGVATVATGASTNNPGFFDFNQQFGPNHDIHARASNIWG